MCTVDVTSGCPANGSRHASNVGGMPGAPVLPPSSPGARLVTVAEHSVPDIASSATSGAVPWARRPDHQPVRGIVQTREANNAFQETTDAQCEDDACPAIPRAASKAQAGLERRQQETAAQDAAAACEWQEELRTVSDVWFAQTSLAGGATICRTSIVCSTAHRTNNGRFWNWMPVMTGNGHLTYRRVPIP